MDTANTNPPLTFANAPEWLRLEGAAELAGNVSVRTIRRWVSVGFIRASKPAGGIVLIDRDSLRAFIDGGARSRRG